MHRHNTQVGQFRCVQNARFSFQAAPGVELNAAGADESANASAGCNVEPAIDDDISRGLAVDGHGPGGDAFQENNIGVFAQGETAALHFTGFRRAGFVNEIPLPLAGRGRGVFDQFHFAETGGTGWN